MYREKEAINYQSHPIKRKFANCQTLAVKGASAIADNSSPTSRSQLTFG